MNARRAWVLLPSRRRLDLLCPDPFAWTDRDLAIGLSRTYRWGGYSRWSRPLSVAQHSLTVLVLAERRAGSLTLAEQRRELLHDATEALLGALAPVTPLKLHLGECFATLTERMQAAVDLRYQLPLWDSVSYRRHKEADRLAAASEAFHVAGWSRAEMRDDLEIALSPLEQDPLPPERGFEPWEPWSASFATNRFFERLEAIAAQDPTSTISTKELVSL